MNTTREELNDLATTARYFAGQQRSGTDRESFEKMAALLESYPLPAAEGERARAAGSLEGLAAGLAVRFDCDEETKRSTRAAILRHAAALLLAPAAGVSREAVLGEIERIEYECDLLRRGVRYDRYIQLLEDAVRALPEAQPEPASGVSRERVVLLTREWISRGFENGDDLIEASRWDIDDRQRGRAAMGALEDLGWRYCDVPACGCGRFHAPPPEPADDDWHYLPEMPPDGDVRDFWCWTKGGMPEVKSYETEDEDAYRWIEDGVYCWREIGAAPPLAKGGA